MTNNRLVTRYRKGLVSFLLLAMTLGFGVMISAEAGEYVKEGLKIAVECVIPTSFPFMIISDLYLRYGRPENIRILQKCFSWLFGCRGYGLAPFICGNVGGFPIGAKMVADRYASGQLTKDEAQRLLPLCNNPSSAFIIGGVGLGIYHSMRVGVLLLISVYASTLLCGIASRKNSVKNEITLDNSEQIYIFSNSVKRAGLSCISIISFICIFSAINGVIKKRIKSTIILCAFLAISEVTNAVKFFASTPEFADNLSLALSAFSLGFGGLCVGMQSSAFTLSTDLSMMKYYRTKTLEGVLSASIFSILFYIMK